ncbi:MAG: dienelactone hydrolase family protein, partial [Verrucomicrobiota bacterium]|nr:dienelactone hydrolase family protein [Verrucomicrobiota bacterium]
MKILLSPILFFLSLSIASAEETSLDSLKNWIALPQKERNPIKENEFANSPISKSEANEAKEILWKDHISLIKSQRSNEMKQKRISIGDKTLKYDYLVFGEKPETGRSLYISMHGGGGAPPQVNEGQWKNQMRLYKPKEGIYLCPRAPTDTWNLWHQAHIDPLFDRLIENMIIFNEVDPDKVYLMGYSAGGDGVYQLAPRMCDRFAAAAMMAGHPNETSPLGLRNLPFALHMGENDKAYNRNKIAASWGDKLTNLRKEDPKGYEHFVKIHKNKGHW